MRRTLLLFLFVFSLASIFSVTDAHAGNYGWTRGWRFTNGGACPTFNIHLRTADLTQTLTNDPSNFQVWIVDGNNPSIQYAQSLSSGTYNYPGFDPSRPNEWDVSLCGNNTISNFLVTIHMGGHMVAERDGGIDYPGNQSVTWPVWIPGPGSSDRGVNIDALPTKSVTNQMLTPNNNDVFTSSVINRSFYSRTWTSVFDSGPQTQNGNIDLINDTGFQLLGGTPFSRLTYSNVQKPAGNNTIGYRADGSQYGPAGPAPYDGQYYYRTTATDYPDSGGAYNGPFSTGDPDNATYYLLGDIDATSIAILNLCGGRAGCNPDGNTGPIVAGDPLYFSSTIHNYSGDIRARASNSRYTFDGANQGDYFTPEINPGADAGVNSPMWSPGAGNHTVCIYPNSSSNLNLVSGSARAICHSFTVQAVPSPQPIPTCSRVGTQGDVLTTSQITGTFYMYAYGVQNATAVRFPTWSNYLDQNDLYPDGWIAGQDLGGGTWRAAIDMSHHTELGVNTGPITTDVYMFNATYANIACGRTGVIVQPPPQPNLTQVQVRTVDSNGTSQSQFAVGNQIYATGTVRNTGNVDMSSPSGTSWTEFWMKSYFDPSVRLQMPKTGSYATGQSYTFCTAPSGSGCSLRQVLSWTPGAGDVGQHTIHAIYNSGKDASRTGQDLAVGPGPTYENYGDNDSQYTYTIVPAAPTNTTSAAVDCVTQKLSWAGGAGATSFLVQLQDATGGSLGAPRSVASPSTSYNWTDLNENTSYRWAVIAANGAFMSTVTPGAPFSTAKCRKIIISMPPVTVNPGNSDIVQPVGVNLTSGGNWQPGETFNIYIESISFGGAVGCGGAAFAGPTPAIKNNLTVSLANGSGNAFTPTTSHTYAITSINSFGGAYIIIHTPDNTSPGTYTVCLGASSSMIPSKYAPANFPWIITSEYRPFIQVGSLNGSRQTGDVFSEGPISLDARAGGVRSYLFSPTGVAGVVISEVNGAPRILPMPTSDTAREWLARTYAPSQASTKLTSPAMADLIRSITSSNPPVVTAAANAVASRCDASHPVAQYNSNVVTISSWTGNQGCHVIIINGNSSGTGAVLNITSNISSDRTIFIVRGNVAISSNVTQINASIIWSGTFNDVAGSVPADQQLVVNGSLIALTGSDGFNVSSSTNGLRRTNSNKTAPSELINYDPAYLVEFPGLLGSSTYSWIEE